MRRSTVIALSLVGAACTAQTPLEPTPLHRTALPEMPTVRRDPPTAPTKVEGPPPMAPTGQTEVEESPPTGLTKVEEPPPTAPTAPTKVEESSPTAPTAPAPRPRAPVPIVRRKL